MKSNKQIPVIDLFAGPGGLGEGFSSLYVDGEPVFDIKLSIEKDPSAHSTLMLRSFFRKFPRGEAPYEYYDLLKIQDNKIRDIARQELYSKYPKQAADAEREAWCAQLGGKNFPSDVVNRRISDALRNAKNWVLIGGPPCQAYSLAGRSRVGGIDEKDHRVYLYLEYLRIIASHHPAVFVMENVQGLLSARLNGEKIFHNILRDLKRPGSIFPDLKSPEYNIYSFVKPETVEDADYLIKSEEYGVPQNRHRVILLGIRNDIESIPATLTKKSKVSLGSVIGDLPKVRSALNREHSQILYVGEKKIRKYRQIVDSPEKWEKTVNEFMSDIFSWLNVSMQGKILKSPNNNTGSEFIYTKKSIKGSHPLHDWYNDFRMNGVVHHSSRSHLKGDLLRYLYLSIYSNIYHTFPRVNEYLKHSEKLLPDHENVLSGKFADRFRVQNAEDPATTITSHISKDGHYYIHYDYTQCRSLTVREAARIQTFPDNYLFCGSRTQQFHQVGNAVPPYLAYQLASIVYKMLSL